MGKHFPTPRRHRRHRSFQSLSLLARFLVKCMRVVEGKPSALHARALHEIIANLLRGTHQFSPDASALIEAYHEQLTHDLWKACTQQHVRARLVHLLDAMEYHGTWSGMGSAIDWEELPDVPYWDEPDFEGFSWRTVRWQSV